VAETIWVEKVCGGAKMVYSLIMCAEETVAPSRELFAVHELFIVSFYHTARCCKGSCF
jgi:hypothetical protein